MDTILNQLFHFCNSFHFLHLFRKRSMFPLLNTTRVTIPLPFLSFLWEKGFTFLAAEKVLIRNVIILLIYCSWLLHDPKMELRSTYPPYLKAVDRFFNKLFEILVPLQVIVHWSVYVNHTPELCPCTYSSLTHCLLHKTSLQIRLNK